MKESERDESTCLLTFCRFFRFMIAILTLTSVSPAYLGVFKSSEGRLGAPLHILNNPSHG